MNQLGSRTSRGFPLFSSGKFRLNPTMVLGIIILTALLAFEMFNYSTTEYALSDLLGDLRFASIRWATILSIAFCGIDFAGIARLFTPEQGNEEPKEVWYLFGAWLLAATMNAMLTWWGVSMAIVNHSMQSTQVVSASTLTKVVPAFVAIMVWVIRILIIGSLSVAGDRMLWGAKHRSSGVGTSVAAQAGSPRPAYAPGAVRSAAGSLNASAAMPRSPLSMRPPTPAPRSAISEPSTGRPEPTYHSISGSSEIGESAKGQNTSTYSKF
jgi:hypothetical protein